MAWQATPFILLEGNAKEAIGFYEEALGARAIFKQTYGESPDASANMSAEAGDRVAHSILKIGEAQLFVADSYPGSPNASGNRVQVCLTVPDAETAARIFDALREEGQVVEPLRKVHFSPAYGVVTDRFGVTFQIFASRPQM